MTEEQSRLTSTEALTKLVREVDPLYMPASFLLGYVHLRRGEAEEAMQAFDPILEPFKREFQHTAALLRQRFVRQPRFLRLVKHSRSIKKWADFFIEELSYLRGGQYFSAGDTWEVIKRRLAEEGPDESRSEFNKAIIESLTNSLSKELDGASTPKEAAGLGAVDENRRRSARKVLDELLDLHEMRLFNAKLTVVHAMSLGTRIKDILRDNEQRDLVGPDAELQQEADELSRFSIAKLLKNQLSIIKSCIQDGHWEELDKGIKSVQLLTREPDKEKFAELLNDRRMETFGARVAGFFLPSLHEVRKMQQRVRSFLWPNAWGRVRLPLYIEASYYAMRAMVLTFDPEKLKEAAEQASKVREAYPRWASKNMRDLYVLMMSLETEAVLRLHEQTQDSKSNFEVRIREKHAPFLQRAAQNHRLRPDTRAAAYVSSGLFQRDERRSQKEARLRAEREDADADDISRYDEVTLYMKSLDLAASASAHCYIAECRLEEGRTNEARGHLREALAMCPEHILAKKLTRQMESQAPMR